MSQSQSRSQILIVDDKVHNLKVLRELIEGHGHEARPVSSGRHALRAATRQPPDLILLDINMPEMDGYEVCRQLKADPTTAKIPVIFVSALNESFDKVRAFESGGVDYVSKPFQFEELLARIETHLQLSHTRRQLNESYRELQRLETMRDDLVHMMVHDMRSPLMAIGTLASCLLEDLGEELEPEHREDLVDLSSASRRLVRMTNDLLDLRRLEEDQLPLNETTFDLGEMVSLAAASVRGLDSTRVVKLHAEGSTLVRADADLVRRVLENLIGNGLKHTAPSDPLHVELCTIEGEVRVEVRDRGPGVPSDSQERIFERYTTVDLREERRYHSAGMGLAFCKLAVTASGGRIGVDSVVGDGSTFWFTLPLA